MTKTNQKANAALEKKVRTAISELDQEGVRITNAKVREKSGGSFRDVGPIVKAILAEREAREQAESQVPDMPEDVLELTTALWEAAFRAADAAAATDRRNRADEIKALKEELAERETELGIIEDEKDQACARAVAAEHQVAEGVETVVQMKIAAALLEGRIVGLQEALRSQAVTMPKEDEPAEDEPARDTGEIEQMLMFRAPDRPDGMEDGFDPESTMLAEHTPDGEDEEGATGMPQAERSARRTRKVGTSDTGDLPGINSL